MTKFWQTKPKKEKQEDWKKPLFRKPLCKEVHLKPNPSCACGGTGWVVQEHATALCWCIMSQVQKAERDKTAIVLRSP